MKTWFLSIGLCLGCGALLPIGVSTADDAAEPVIAVFECPPGFEFVARFERQAARVVLPDGTRQLPQLRSGSGARYGDGEVTLWTKGQQAMLDTPAQSYKGCENNRERAVWEQAKLAGADFRATGNEPPWSLEVHQEKLLILTIGYDHSRYEFPLATLESDSEARTTVYRTEGHGKTLRVELLGRSCSDTMVERTYPTTVTVRFGSQTLHGCGRALH